MTGIKEKAIVIGASAGALEALGAVLSPLPADYELPIIIVVHIPPDKKSVMAEVLQTKCSMTVKEAEDKEPLSSGTVYISPPDYHLLVEKEGILSLSVEDPVLYSRPSINVLFETAADAFGEQLIGIILTGANHDGADGITRVCGEGGKAIVLDPAKAFVSTMPEAALRACPAAEKMSLEEISSYLKKVCHR